MDGGELFDRIIDDNCSLTEFDTILFIRQICEGIRHMHQMYILHLDLKVGCALPHRGREPFPQVGPWAPRVQDAGLGDRACRWVRIQEFENSGLLASSP